MFDHLLTETLGDNCKPALLDSPNVAAHRFELIADSVVDETRPFHS